MKNTTFSKFFFSGLLAAALAGLSMSQGCSTDADVASRNLATAAEQFQIARRITFVNGITNEYLLVMEGLCSLEAQPQQRQLESTCKVGEGPDGKSLFKKNHLGLSDNVFYFSEQIEATPVSAYHYKVIFKPQSIVPDVDLKIDLGG